MIVSMLYSPETSTGATLDRRYFSIPRPISFPTGPDESFKVGCEGKKGEVAHGFVYMPQHPLYEPLATEKPPLIVKVHGGPTSSASTCWRLDIQFWTSRGFAVLDVDYRGSSGYGRSYRQKLTECQGWGVLDIEDVCCGAAHLALENLVDGSRLCIEGRSAGGFTCLLALATTDVFRAGCSRYGIADITMLVKETHKFELRYPDHLIGPWPEAEAVYKARSALEHLDSLRCPVLLQQGLKDRVVPPSQAVAMYDAVKAKGIPCALLEFPDEGHGFKKADAIEKSLNAELFFYGKILGFTPDDPIDETVILLQNLPTQTTSS